MNQKDKQLLNELQFNFPVSEHPYKDVGKILGLSEDKVIKNLEHFLKVLRREKIL